MTVKIIGSNLFCNINIIVAFLFDKMWWDTGRFADILKKRVLKCKKKVKM